MGENRVKEFFEKYHAAPATAAGIDWATTAPDVLVGWARADLATWSSGVRNPKLAERMFAIGVEISVRRSIRCDAVNLRGDSPADKDPVRYPWAAIASDLQNALRPDRPKVLTEMLSETIRLKKLRGV